MTAHGSAYGAGAPTYRDTDLQRSGIEGRLKVARGLSTRYRQRGDTYRADKWAGIADELLDRLLEVRGR